MKKIMVIEDNLSIRENTSEILRLANYKVVSAADGREGIAEIIKERPDLILCDIMMPELDGYGVLTALQRHPELRNTPFIFVTAKTEREEQRKGMGLGADDYISKPFSGTELLEAVEGRLKKREALQKEFSSGISGVNELMKLTGNIPAMSFLTDGRNTEKFKKKQPLYSEGGRPTRLMYLLSGKVKVYKVNEDGKELVVKLCSEGDFLGYGPLLEGTNYRESAEAIEDAEVAMIPKEDFMELIYGGREVMEKFISMLARDVREQEQRLLGIAYNSLRKKVAESLISLHRKYHKEGVQFAIGISRENLAAIAGTATESLIRTLGDFREEKLIEIADGKIAILNLKKLEEMFN